jgi:hypothetical protein
MKFVCCPAWAYVMCTPRSTFALTSLFLEPTRTILSSVMMLALSVLTAIPILVNFQNNPTKIPNETH